MIEYITIALLALIAFAELYRLYLTQVEQTKKQHFKQKVTGVNKMIWDLEFKRFKTAEIREGVRKEYDNLKSRLFSTEEQVKNFPKDGDKAVLAGMEDQVVILKRDVTRKEDTLKALDAEIDGIKVSKENPDGQIGITENIDSLHELMSMVKDWLKRI